VGIAIGIDIYGTLVDPQEMSIYLRPLVGSLAEKIAEVWRVKQLEYSFRRAAMKLYEDFSVCTRQALSYALDSQNAQLSTAEQNQLIENYQQLHALPDVVPGLRDLKAAGHTLCAFSNGLEKSARKLLTSAGLISYFDGILSTDEVKTFKPDPRVYQLLQQWMGGAADETWLVSSNAFDVIGAKAAGLRAAWIKRDPNKVFDRWDILPDAIAPILRTRHCNCAKCSFVKMGLRDAPLGVAQLFASDYLFALISA
jgi:2-haloacid dehalogenase